MQSYLWPFLGGKRVASGNNNSDRNSTLPAPELNPLLNPVLGAHMGRWAEVYFTSPPEKREEAVLDLLRELQGGEPAPRPLADTSDSVREHPSQIPSELAQKAHQEIALSPSQAVSSSETVSLSQNDATESEVDWIVCESCGGRNTPGNRYCGMCAEPLTQGNAVIPELRKETMWGTFVERAPERDHDNLDNKNLDHATNLDYKIPSDQRYDDARPALASEISERDETRFAAPIDSLRNDPPLSPSSSWPERPAVPSLLVEYDQPTNRRRIYGGAIVGILIAGLVYVAWRASANRSDSTHILPQPTPTAAETQPPTPEQTPASAPPQNETTQVPAVKVPATAEAHPAAAKAQAHRRADTTARRETNAPTPTSAAEDQAGGPIVAPLLGNGSEELTVAESYLNGTNGKVRDPSEAAKWLWRSFGKKNGAAALLLSDLYVRGEGVPQSCDQARLLLDAAARKGAAGAAERITSLPSRGCP